ncbi:uncharacterized protein NECHADRAFT_84920 [Fusarium vanettenii 77-13-4]|uniref:Uncharacterized protein n=1 Tax=Fusarium vanettenii (strain ATCC MYA-4622 / CBS 123669 / FGSC 9596 / NRRL 45880 / 77-13-4) TaxID=660122 RepID=C7YUH1_FUSV7|nr:uncharacterized protein NECHADRAFT_84920 [Fusarium vanettenii 77-13-4]EEU44802.1 hypothetical protein NECHADRAFT_84920 [Fusarium vanettenii 77-13-4]
MKHILILGTLWTAQTVAQRYTYTTQTMTECFSSTQADFGPAAPTQGPDKYWTVEMPECHDCNCPDCAYTNTYTTTLDVFSPKGLAKYPYEIKEIYRGMSTMPADATPTSMPYGFTSAVETCNICGDEPIVATMTYPRGDSPYRENVPAATGVVETKFERPSTLRTKVVGEEPTATPSGDGQDDDETQLENTLVHHKAIAVHGADPDDFSDFGIGDGTIYDDEEEKDDQDSTPTIEKLNNFHELEEPAAAPSKEKDNAAGSIQPPAKAALALLLPLAFII